MRELLFTYIILDVFAGPPLTGSSPARIMKDAATYIQIQIPGPRQRPDDFL